MSSSLCPYSVPTSMQIQQSSELCLQTLSTVFRADLTGMASLEIVRLLNRMIKERHFKVHPNVLSCFLHLRLRTELGVRSSDTHADKPDTQKQKRVKGKRAAPVYLSKKAKKALKEQKEINKELREAEAEVDKEERKTTVRIYWRSCFPDLIWPSCATSKRRHWNFSLLCIFVSSKIRRRHPFCLRHLREFRHSLTWSTLIFSKISFKF